MVQGVCSSMCIFERIGMTRHACTLAVPARYSIQCAVFRLFNTLIYPSASWNAAPLLVAKSLVDLQHLSYDRCDTPPSRVQLHFTLRSREQCYRHGGGEQRLHQLGALWHTQVDKLWRQPH